MKNITTLILFLILNVINTHKIKSLFNTETNDSPSKILKKLFKVPRTNACSKTSLINQIRADIMEEREENGSGGRRGRNHRFFWIKQWGYGPVAYLFDYFDPILRDQTVNEMDKIVIDLRKFPVADLRYKDPFDFKKLISQDSTLLNNRLMRMLKRFTKNYDPQVYDLSVNAVQIRYALPQWKWNIDVSNLEFPVKLIKQFDLNFDGRLNPRELILASIIQNKGILGTQLCQNCFNNSTKVMDAIFLYLDCNNDGWLSAEEFWSNLNNLKRGTNKFNIYSFGIRESIRTAAINDFVIKNGKIKEGYITKAEFRNGLLLGMWDRQTEKTGVLLDDSRTLKNLRWREDDTIDISLYNYYKKRIAKSIK
jgi:hypothetical protein